jgi:hypothetical protein
LYNYITMNSVILIKLDKTVCVSKTATQFDLGQVILKVTTILITRPEKDNTEILVLSQRIKYNKYWKSNTNKIIVTIRRFF